METLPNEIFGETAANLTNQQLIAFCSGVNKRIQKLCKEQLIPNRIKKYLSQGAVLPYDEKDPIKQLLIYESIYGSDLAAAHLVHPDYAVFQAIKFNNTEVIDKYTKYCSRKLFDGYHYGDVVLKTTSPL